MKKWTIDPSHSEIGFKIKHLVISTVRGRFGVFSGSILAADESFDNAEIEFTADVSSLTTHDTNRDSHLQSADFFDTEKFPHINFKSTKVQAQDNGALSIVGHLTIRDITKSVTLNATLMGVTNDMYGGHVAAFEVAGQFSRSDFGLTWNAALETGGVVVGDTVTLEATIEVKQEN